MNLKFNEKFFFQPFFTDRVFQIFDRDNSGAISLQEFLDAMHELAGKTPDDKFKFLFKVYDIDGKIVLYLFNYVFRSMKINRIKLFSIITTC